MRSLQRKWFTQDIAKTNDTIVNLLFRVALRSLVIDKGHHNATISSAATCALETTAASNIGSKEVSYLCSWATVITAIL